MQATAIVSPARGPVLAYWHMPFVQPVPPQHSASDAHCRPIDLQHAPLKQLSASKQQSVSEAQLPPAGSQQVSGWLVMVPSASSIVPVPQIASPQQAATPPPQYVPGEAQHVVPFDPEHWKPLQQSPSPLGHAWPLPLQQLLLLLSQLPLQQSVPSTQSPTSTPKLTQQYAPLTQTRPLQQCEPPWQLPL
jgi:hypothetical protein